MQRYTGQNQLSMLINNHFSKEMEAIDILNKEFSKQDFPEETYYTKELEKHISSAWNYANCEKQIAVLSDLHTGQSYIFYGDFSKKLNLRPKDTKETIGSIWEKNILKRIHPESLKQKYINELFFFNFIKRQSGSKKNNFHLYNRIYMKDCSGKYIPVLHRTSYIYDSSTKRILFALCLYGPLWTEMKSDIILDCTTGNIIDVRQLNSDRILTERETQILKCIASGMMSKDIAYELSISKNTVSRHRQEILKKLQVRNSIEACRIARELGLL